MNPSGHSGIDLSQLDAQHPWPGLAPFEESGGEYFHGREKEKAEIVRRVRAERLTVFHGISGLGKTSLLKAGLFPELRTEHFLPVYVRLRFDNSSEAATLVDQVHDAVAEEFRRWEIAVERGETGVDAQPGSLWEFFQAEGTYFWNARHRMVTPVLVFDQFEEVFTLGHAVPEQREALFEELACLVENRPPSALRERMEESDESPPFHFDEERYRIVVSLREDYLSDLLSLQGRAPTILNNHMRLLPMNGARTCQALLEAGSAVLDRPVAERLTRFVAGVEESRGTPVPLGRLEIEPALLSLVCFELNNRRLAMGHRHFSEDLITGHKKEIFPSFYENCLRGAPVEPRVFIEERLLTEDGHRRSEAVPDFLRACGLGMVDGKALLERLVSLRLVHVDAPRGLPMVELTHDVLTAVVRESRDKRRQEEALRLERERAERLLVQQRAQRRRHLVTVSMAVFLAAVLVAVVWLGYYAYVQEHRDYYATWVKRRGFPEGVWRLSEDEARKRPYSFLLVRKGIRWNGWRPHFNPPHRMVAVNGHLLPTTEHFTGTYLWDDSEAYQSGNDGGGAGKGERLGLRKVCSWEFVADARGDIAYERGLDRDGKMVWGLVYTPHDSASESQRLARFVGPDGFAQLQRDTPAEYVRIEYDREGWEKRILYRDGRNRPARGPNRAFGIVAEHDRRGLRTQTLSVGWDGETPIVDNAGNTGMRMKYDERGLMVEADSIGPDLQPMTLKVGFARITMSYDRFGRRTEARVFGEQGEPIFCKDGWHGWKAEFDGEGNEIVRRHLGLNGEVIIVSNGVGVVRQGYDERGRAVGAAFHGVSEEPVLLKEGWHAWTAQFDAEDNEVARTYLGLDGKPVLLPEGYSAIVREHDQRGRVLRTSCRGVSGEPVLHKEGWHAWVAQYDEQGNEIVRTYLGLDGLPVAIEGGYATIRKRFDTRGHEIEWACFDARGKPVLDSSDGTHKVVTRYDDLGAQIARACFGMSGEPALHKDGWHAWIAEVDGEGNETAKTWLGVDEQPVALEKGYATVRMTFDGRGDCVELRYLDVRGEPAFNENHVQVVGKRYNARHLCVEERYFDVEGRPTANSNGIHYGTVLYASNGKMSEIAAFGVDGNPVPFEDGASIKRWIFDAGGNEIEVSWFGPDGEPILMPDGYATVKSEFDTRGNPVCRTYHGVSGEPVLCKEGFHRMVAEYGHHGLWTEKTTLGLDGRAILTAEGHATIKREYDAWGKETRETYFGVSGEPVLGNTGLHGVTTEYDHRGRWISKTGLGLDGKPALAVEGFAVVRNEYDSQGNVVYRSYHGVSGGPVLCRDGYHAWQAEYDAQGKLAERTFIDLGGNPVDIRP